MTLTQYLADLRGKQVTVIGIGVSNRPLLRLLAEAGAMVTARDKKTEDQLGEVALQLKEWGVKLVLGEQYMENIEGDVVFRTPGLRPDHPGLLAAAGKGAHITSEMEVFFEVCPCPVIAVTGSDGKTTTTSVIAEMLRAAGKTVWLGGNIGTPLLDQADKMTADHVAVLELSSFQLMSMKKTPAVAVITNLSPNHLDWHRDFAEYVEAKCNLFKNQGKEDVLVLNFDNLPSRELAEKAPGQVRFFSRESLALPGGVWLKNGEMLDNGEPIMEIGDIRIPGMHNVENYMAAYCAVSGMVDDEVFRTVARDFSGVQHRLELIRTHKGVKYINDSIASSPTRAVAGLRSFKDTDSVILIAGGHDKHVPFDEMADEVCKRCKALFLCGESALAIEAAVKASAFYTEAFPMFVYENWTENVLEAAKYAVEGDTVLLSPACSSFDFFKNFAERGNLFRKIVMELE